MLNTDFNFTNPYRMNDVIIIGMGSYSTKAKNRSTVKSIPNVKLDKLLLMKPTKVTNSIQKTQNIFDKLQRDCQRQMSIVHQKSCQNPNNLLLLIEWLSFYNPTLAARLLL
ncbi:hypothetical protein LOAG_10740 [Loa loa]|uniref:Transposase n=1 Tax=Loa loa TaxID=7209 RepID=A0A1I7VL80_LOALO|nr:hypothetical protein LOAG_10740 [Loa loa]EFO17758.2 hypothetical protein LOAG_10740 [Loa loa]